MEGINDFLKKRADQLGLDRADQISEIQQFINRRIGVGYRVKSLNNGVVKIHAASASAASELRYRQHEVASHFKVKVAIVIQ